jgi:hypothetical protein
MKQKEKYILEYPQVKKSSIATGHLIYKTECGKHA